MRRVWWIGVLLAALMLVPSRLWGQGGRFERQDVIPSPETTFAHFGDMDGDGDLDVVGVQPRTRSIIWWANTTGVGAKPFDVHQITSATTPEVVVIALGDVDGDQALDVLALAPDTRVDVYLNDGQGVFPDRPSFRVSPTRLVTYIETTDVNEDGLADLFAIKSSNKIELWLNAGVSDGQVTFEPRQVISVSSSSVVRRLAAGDIDGDGRIDLATVNWGDDRLDWYRQDEAGDFQLMTPGGYRLDQASDVSVGDLNLDGRPDIVAMRENPYQVFAWWGVDGTEFVKPAANEYLADHRFGPGSGGRPWKSLDVGDINRDGAPDLLVSEPAPGGDVCWYRNPAPAPSPTPGASATTAASPTPTGSSPTETPGTSPTASPSPPPATTVHPSSTPTATSTRVPSPTATEEAPEPPAIYLPFAVQVRS